MTDSLNTTTDQNEASWQNEFLKTNLHEGIVNVTFIKKDGTERKMRCTLKTDLLPHKEDTLKPIHSNPDVQAVWDLDTEGWRSFRYDSIIGFNIE